MIKDSYVFELTDEFKASLAHWLISTLANSS